MARPAWVEPAALHLRVALLPGRVIQVAHRLSARWLMLAVAAVVPLARWAALAAAAERHLPLPKPEDLGQTRLAGLVGLALQMQAGLAWLAVARISLDMEEAAVVAAQRV